MLEERPNNTGEILPGVFVVGSFITSIQEWFKLQPCLVKQGYRYQVKKKEDRDNFILITVLKVTEVDQSTEEFLNDYI